MNWHEYFFKLADLASEKSKDPSTKVGAVIVGPDNEIRSTGFNGFPRGVDETLASRWERPEKYQWVEHAERNAIYNAARVGIPTKGCTMYVQWVPWLCVNCSRAVIQAGITTIIGRDREFVGKGKSWDEELRIGKEMLLEAGVELLSVPDIGSIKRH